MAFRFVFIAVAHDSYGSSLTTELPEEPQRELLSVILDVSIVFVCAPAIKQLRAIVATEFGPADPSLALSCEQLFAWAPN